MERKLYRENVIGLLPLHNQTPQTIQNYFQYLNIEQAFELIYGHSEFFAAPPLLIDNTFQILVCRRDFDHGRTPRVTVQPPRDAGTTFPSSQGYYFINEALQFARNNWGNVLVPGNFGGAMLDVYIENPEHLLGGKPRLETILYVVFNLDIETLKKYPDSGLPTEWLDDRIVYITTDIYESYELRATRHYIATTNCIRCGSPLNRDNCPGCGINFYPHRFYNSWKTPLTAKMIETIRKQFVIENHPNRISLGKVLVFQNVK